MSAPKIVWHDHDCDCSFCDPVKAAKQVWFRPSRPVRTLTTESLITGEITEHWRRPTPDQRTGDETL